MRRRANALQPDQPKSDPAVLASMEEPQTFKSTVNGKEYTVTDTLSNVMARASAKFGGSADWHEYDRRKRDWLRLHPTATDSAYEQACRRISKELGL